MKSKMYLFLNSYRIIITLILILLILLIYNFSNSFLTNLEGYQLKTNSKEAKDEIEKSYKKMEAENKGNVMQNERKYTNMHNRAF